MNVLAHNWGEAILPDTGEIDGDVITAFTRGHCHSFALAMHQETGWPIFGIGKGFLNDVPAHCVVYCPQLDDYIDIEGPGVRERHQRLIDLGIELLEPEQVCSLRNYRTPQPDAAKPFVKTVLQSLPTEPVHVTKDLLTISRL